ncbi:MAG: hypothetical protein AAB436_04020 [Patescibacteria group bacterium]
MMAPQTALVMAIVEAGEGHRIDIPPAVQNINALNQKLSENAYGFGSDELHKAAARVVELTNTEMVDSISAKFDMLVKHFNMHEQSIIRLLGKNTEHGDTMIAAYVGTILLKDEVAKDYSEDAKHLEVFTSLVDSHGQVGVQPEGYGLGRLLVRDDKLDTLGLTLR